MTVKTFTHIFFIIFISYFLAQVLYFIVMAIVALIHSRRMTMHLEEDDYSVLFSSDFTVPVTIIVPAHNEERSIEDTVLSLININYPSYEAIIVNDGSTDSTMPVLERLLDLEPTSITYNQRFPDGMVHEIYRSVKYPNFLVISKSGGHKKAGAVNAGLNIARYKYICVIDADTIIEPDAFTNLMSHVEKNPEKIIGIGSYFGLVNGFSVKKGRILKRSFSFNPLIAYQNLEYLRGFIGIRFPWSNLNAVPILAGGFSIWRIDILAKVGGFSENHTCEDMEITFRVRDYIVREKTGQSILSLPYYTAWTSGPENIKSLISQRERWQRVENESISAYRHMLFNPRFGNFGFITMPYFFFYECLGPFFEAVSYALVFFSFLAGILDVSTFMALFIFMGLAQSVISSYVLAVAMRTVNVFELRYVIYMLVLGLFEMLLYRPIILVAKVQGTLNFFFGVKGFTQYKR